jgi:hypothetical protein
MKTILYTLVFILVTLAPQTVEAQLSFGGGTAFTANISEPGVFVRSQYPLSRLLTVAVSFNFFFTDSEVTTLNGDFDVQYALPDLFENKEEKLKPYILMGGHLGQRAFEARKDDRYTDRAINAGVGLRYVKPRVTYLTELKYNLRGPGIQVSAGVLFALGEDNFARDVGSKEFK